jgi:hypothetical protein
VHYKFIVGPWRNKVVFVADDGDKNIHMRDSEHLSLLKVMHKLRKNYMLMLFLKSLPQMSITKVREKLNQTSRIVCQLYGTWL